MFCLLCNNTSKVSRQTEKNRTRVSFGHRVITELNWETIVLRKKWACFKTRKGVCELRKESLHIMFL